MKGPNAEKTDGGLTHGGCSGNVLLPASPSIEFDWSANAVAGVVEQVRQWMSDEDEVEIEALQAGWEEEAAKALLDIDRVVAGNGPRVVESFWKEKGDEEVQECRIVCASGKGQKLSVYFSDGEGRTATLQSWKIARTRAGLAMQQGKRKIVTFPWPLKGSIYQALESELIQTGRPMTLTKWGRLFRLLHPECRRYLWAEFRCNRCQRKRRTEALATEPIMQAALRQEAVCALVGLGCGQPSTDQVLPWVPIAGTKEKEDELTYCSARQDGLEKSQEEHKLLDCFLSQRRESAKSTTKPEMSSDDEEELKAPKESNQGGGYSIAAMKFYKASGKSLPLQTLMGAHQKQLTWPGNEGLRDTSEHMEFARRMKRWELQQKC